MKRGRDKREYKRERKDWTVNGSRGRSERQLVREKKKERARWRFKEVYERGK